MKNLQNFHIIEISFLGPTNTKGSRVKLRSHRFDSAVIIPFDHEFSWTYQVAQNWLEKNGFDLLGMGESKNAYQFISTTFKNLK